MLSPIVKEAINALKDDVCVMYDRFDPNQIKDWVDYHTLHFTTPDRKLIQDAVLKYVPEY